MADEPEVGGGLDQMTKAELKGEARARGLRASGTREELLRRVREHDTGAGGDGDAQPPAPGDEGPRGRSEEGGPVGEHGDEAGGAATAAPARHGDDEEHGVAAAREHTGDGRDGGGEHDGAGDGRPHAAGRLGELLVGQPVESVSGVRAIDGGFRVDVEVVEVSRIPPTTDVLATYEVDLDAEGEVTGFARTDRYYRNQTRDA